jgi:hypothetical protein
VSLTRQSSAGLEAAASHALLARRTIRVEEPSEVTAVITASCEGCSWARAGREGAVLRVTVDGRYSQHLVVTRGAEPAPYRISLGPIEPGGHEIAVVAEREASGTSSTVFVSQLEGFVHPRESTEHVALAHSPVIHARAGTVARFSDVPLLMWYSTEPSARGTWFRYSVIFSNEDGGTPADRLMATWGRLTDIEYVYGVELDAAGRILAEEYQGRDHEFLPFNGDRVGQHPVLYVVTENNMLSDRGTATERFALEPIRFQVTSGSREVVMDAHPWLYRISAEEALREGRVDDASKPGSGKVPDPRRFVYVEACGQTENATIAFDAGFADRGGLMTWASSDGGLANSRVALGGRRQWIERPGGCFRAAVAAPSAAGPVSALRWRAYARPPREGEPPPAPGSVRARLTRINRVFQLEEDYTPGPNLLVSNHEFALPPDGTPTGLAVIP